MYPDTTNKQTMARTAEGDDAAVRRARRLGIGYDLALSIDRETGVHLSLVYFNNVRSDYERALIKDEAPNFLTQHLPAGKTTAALELGGAVYDRSVKVTGELVPLQRALEQFFTTNWSSFSVNPMGTLHIDLRNAGTKMPTTLALFDNWM